MQLARVLGEVVATVKDSNLTGNKLLILQPLTPSGEAAGRTLVAASSLEKDLRGRLKTGADRAAAAEVGKLLAQRATQAGVKEVVFDRGGYLFHGRVKALADAAREGGLSF